MTALHGTLKPESPLQSTVRIVALDANGAVCAETRIDAQGQWRLSAPVPIASLIAQLTGDGIAASLAAAADGIELSLPERHPCRFEFTSAPIGGRLWIDPASLDGFPDDRLPALRLHENGTIDLHLGDYPCSPDGLLVHLQAGRYRIGGGRIALHPGSGGADAGLQVTLVEDLRSGQPLAAQGADFILTVDPVAFRVSFGSAGGQTP